MNHKMSFTTFYGSQLTSNPATSFDITSSGICGYKHNLAVWSHYACFLDPSRPLGPVDGRQRYLRLRAKISRYVRYIHTPIYSGTGLRLLVKILLTKGYPFLFFSFNPLKDEQQGDAYDNSRVGHVEGIPMMVLNIEIQKIDNPSMKDSVQQI